MALKITIRNNGPLAVDLTTGELELVDHEGNPVPLPEGKKIITLCRCGASSRKPFCDSTHSKVGFKGANEAREQFDAEQRGSAQGNPPTGPGNGSSTPQG